MEDTFKAHCVWSLHPNELDKYNLRIINDYLVEAPCNYINHPYLWKTLIPIHSYDNLIEKALLDEEIKLFAALGAKKIKVKHQEIHSSKFDAQMKKTTYLDHGTKMLNILAEACDVGDRISPLV